MPLLDFLHIRACWRCASAVAPLVGVTDLRSSMHVPRNRLGEDLVVGCHGPLEAEDEGARGGGDSCGLACSDHAYLTMPRSERRKVLHCANTDVCWAPGV
jgi:hypothetical protein